MSYLGTRFFLVTFRPLVQTPRGRQAVERFGLPGFIDGSCRREPDFESEFPSITATCRANKFAPRLRKGDRALYLTSKGKYPGDECAGWRVVALLRVLERFESHEEGASWYRSRNLPLPSNCLVSGNPPKTFDHTNGKPPAEVAQRVSDFHDPERAIRLWDATYKDRVRRYPVFLVCEAEHLETHSPPQLTEARMREVFGKIPGTLNPPEISQASCSQLLEQVGVHYS